MQADEWIGLRTLSSHASLQHHRAALSSYFWTPVLLQAMVGYDLCVESWYPRHFTAMFNFLFPVFGQLLPVLYTKLGYVVLFEVKV